MANPAITLYLIPGASSIFPHILLRYCNISFTPRAVTMDTLPNFASINEKQQVPILMVGDNTVTENPAIAHAIHHMAPDQRLFGNNTNEFVQVCEWMNFIAASVHAQAWGPYIRPWRFTTDTSPETHAGIQECAKQKTLDRFAMIESRLNGKGPWAVGNCFTAVDAYLLPFYMLAKRLVDGLELEVLYPSWTRNTNAVMEMEAVKQTFDCENDLKNRTS